MKAILKQLKYTKELTTTNIIFNTLKQQQLKYCSSTKQPLKNLTVAVIGAPNAGKSTLINNIVGAKVSAVSHVAHTTRTFANGILTLGNTQFIFTDTPGVVSHHVGRRLKMDNQHIRTPKRVASSADILAVVTDISFRRTKDYIDETVLNILNEYSDIPAILIMNKVDMIKRKEDLLFLATLLTKDRQKDEWGYLDYGGSSKFREVFMTSAKDGEGVKELLNYFMIKAVPGPWYYSQDIYSDSSVEKQISEVFRETLLSLFGQEIPWQVKQETVLFHHSESAVRIHHKLTWPKKSQQRYVSTKLEELGKQCTDELEYIFQCPVLLTVDVSQKNKMSKDDLIMF